jgi:alpha-glucuronidase
MICRAGVFLGTLLLTLAGLEQEREGQRSAVTCSSPTCLNAEYPGARTERNRSYDLWLRYTPVRDSARLMQYRTTFTQIVVRGGSPTLDLARTELQSGLDALLGLTIEQNDVLTKDDAIVAGTPASSPEIESLLRVGGPHSVRASSLVHSLRRVGNEGYVIQPTFVFGKHAIIIAANRDIGVLYGVFHLLRLMQTQQPIRAFSVTSAPRIQLRMLDHWDNLDRTVERGYAGPSLWAWDSLPEGANAQRYRDYARANASIGINAAALTNVNANARVLTPEYLTKVAALANTFRPYGIRVFLTARFSAPIEIGGLKTADPLDTAVRAWWKRKADEIYRYVPDFGGFLVKANSEGQPGPQDYHRTHADGANVLADAVAPHGGVVIWRAFVYSSETPADRVKQAYEEFTPLDGKFRKNVLVQVKNGPLDFQPREPFSPLFGAMPKTPLMLELQITKEYLGQDTHLVYLGPLFEEVLRADSYAKGRGSTVARVIDGSLHGYAHTGIAGVSNVGADSNWTGSDFNQANWYAFGRMAWDPSLSAERVADEWTRMTWTNETSTVATITHMMLVSREAVVNYMTPLGLAHIMASGHHYGPGAWMRVRRADQSPYYFHRADTLGLGFDRTASGSNAVSQYFAPVRARYASRSTVPDSLLLWFHHVAWTERLPFASNRTLWEELVRRYYAGVDSVRAMQTEWNAVQGSIDSARFHDVQEDLAIQEREAVWWRDATLQYFQTFSRLPIPAGYEPPAHPLSFYQALHCPVNPRHPRCPEIEH